MSLLTTTMCLASLSAFMYTVYVTVHGFVTSISDSPSFVSWNTWAYDWLAYFSVGFTSICALVFVFALLGHVFGREDVAWKQEKKDQAYREHGLECERDHALKRCKNQAATIQKLEKEASYAAYDKAELDQKCDKLRQLVQDYESGAQVEHMNHHIEWLVKTKSNCLHELNDAQVELGKANGIIQSDRWCKKDYVRARQTRDEYKRDLDESTRLVSELRARIDVLEQTDTSALQRRVNELEAQVKEQPDVSALQRRVNELEAQVKEQPDVSALQRRIAELDAQVKQKDADFTKASADARQKLTKLGADNKKQAKTIIVKTGALRKAGEDLLAKAREVVTLQNDLQRATSLSTAPTSAFPSAGGPSTTPSSAPSTADIDVGMEDADVTESTSSLSGFGQQSTPASGALAFGAPAFGQQSTSASLPLSSSGFSQQQTGSPFGQQYQPAFGQATFGQPSVTQGLFGSPELGANRQAPSLSSNPLFAAFLGKPSTSATTANSAMRGSNHNGNTTTSGAPLSAFSTGTARYASVNSSGSANNPFANIVVAPTGGFGNAAPAPASASFSGLGFSGKQPGTFGTSNAAPAPASFGGLGFSGKQPGTFGTGNAAPAPTPFGGLGFSGKMPGTFGTAN